jgi:hypothetical protein
MLEFYRLRRQIEWVFKGLQSLLGLGHVLKKDPCRVQAWGEGQPCIGLRSERLIRTAEALTRLHSGRLKLSWECNLGPMLGRC